MNINETHGDSSLLDAAPNESFGCLLFSSATVIDSRKRILDECVLA